MSGPVSRAQLQQSEIYRNASVRERRELDAIFEAADSLNRDDAKGSLSEADLAGWVERSELNLGQENAAKLLLYRVLRDPTPGAAKTPTRRGDAPSPIQIAGRLRDAVESAGKDAKRARAAALAQLRVAELLAATPAVLAELDGKLGSRVGSGLRALLTLDLPAKVGLQLVQAFYAGPPSKPLTTAVPEATLWQAAHERHPLDTLAPPHDAYVVGIFTQLAVRAQAIGKLSELLAIYGGDAQKLARPLTSAALRSLEAQRGGHGVFDDLLPYRALFVADDVQVDAEGRPTALRIVSPEGRATELTFERDGLYVRDRHDRLDRESVAFVLGVLEARKHLPGGVSEVGLDVPARQEWNPFAAVAKTTGTKGTITIHEGDGEPGVWGGPRQGPIGGRVDLGGTGYYVLVTEYEDRTWAVLGKEGVGLSAPFYLDDDSRKAFNQARERHLWRARE
jgi:hypothetical protein